MIDPMDMTLDELRGALAPLLPGNAAFDGWTPLALEAAAAELGVPADRARLAFPDGPAGMIDAWFAHVDAGTLAALAPERLAGRRIRERVRMAVWARIEAVAPHREALRRALAVLALPANAAHGARRGWRAADVMWRGLGDRSVDFAWYSKRFTLAAVYAATILALLDDPDPELAETRGFLDRRIEGVMRFEALKARLTPDAERRFSPLRFLGRLRYPPA